MSKLIFKQMTSSESLSEILELRKADDLRKADGYLSIDELAKKATTHDIIRIISYPSSDIYRIRIYPVRNIFLLEIWNNRWEYRHTLSSEEIYRHAWK